MRFEWPWRSRTEIRNEVAEELEFHLAARVRDLVNGGMPLDAARRMARQEFGDLAEARRAIEGIDHEAERDRRRMDWLGEFRQDARFAVRALRRSPAFAGLALATFALGIGVTTSVYSLLHGVLLKPLSIPQADRVVVPQSTRRGTADRWAISYGDLVDWRAAKTFDRVAVFQPDRFDLRLRNDVVRATALVVEADVYPILGVRLLFGRLPNAAEYVPGGPRALVLSERFWRARFGSDSSVIGSTATVSGFPATIVGVLQRIDEPPFDQDVWYPYRLGAPDADRLRRDNYIFQAVASMKPERTLAAVNADLDAQSAAVERIEPRIRKDVRVVADPLSQFVFGRGLVRALWAFMLGVVFVALIGCVNVANLLLARGAARERELAVRSALGAGTGRLLRQMVTETLVLAAGGALLGLGIAWYGVRLLTRLFPADTPRLANTHLDASSFGFALGAAAVAALLAGLYPAVRVALGAGRLAAMVGTRTDSARGDRRVRSSLVFAESLLAAVLIVAALLAIMSARRLARADPGFDPSSQITFNVQVPSASRGSANQTGNYFEQVLERTERIPGVVAAGASWALPLGGGGVYLGRSVVAFGDSPDSPNREVSIQWNIVTPGYWRASGIPLIQGRDFTTADDSAGAPVIIVNRAFATKMFGDSSALGRRILSSRDERIWREIVGVVGDVRVFGLDGQPLAGVYVPHRQNPSGGMTLTVRTAGNPAALAPALRAAVREFDPNAAAANIRTMVEVRHRSMARFVSMSVLATAFGSLALLLAGIGIFGVVSYTVARRAQEVGIRMALGRVG